MARKTTIEELQRILNEPKDHPIIVHNDGSISVDRRRKGRGFIYTEQQSLVKCSY